MRANTKKDIINKEVTDLVRKMVTSLDEPMVDRLNYTIKFQDTEEIDIMPFISISLSSLRSGGNEVCMHMQSDYTEQLNELARKGKNKCVISYLDIVGRGKFTKELENVNKSILFHRCDELGTYNFIMANLLYNPLFEEHRKANILAAVKILYMGHLGNIQKLLYKHDKKDIYKNYIEYRKQVVEHSGHKNQLAIFDLLIGEITSLWVAKEIDSILGINEKIEVKLMDVIKLYVDNPKVESELFDLITGKISFKDINESNADAKEWIENCNIKLSTETGRLITDIVSSIRDLHDDTESFERRNYKNGECYKSIKKSKIAHNLCGDALLKSSCYMLATQLNYLDSLIPEKVAYETMALPLIKRQEQMIESKDRDLSRINGKYESFRDQNKKLRKEIGSLKSKIESIEKDKKRLQDQYDNLLGQKGNVVELSKEISDLTDELNQAKENISDKSFELSKLRSKNSSLTQTVDELKEKIANLEDDKDKLNEKLKNQQTSALNVNIPLENIVNCMANRKITLIGGDMTHQYIAKMGFKKLKIIRAYEKIKFANEIESSELIVVMTAYVSHSLYETAKGIAKSRGIKLLSFNEKNVEMLCREMFNALYSDNTLS